MSLVHADEPRLQALAIFDAVVNNADRKGGHVLVDTAGQVHGIDHGVTFSEDDKLRTVLWGWAGEPLPDPLVDDLARLDSALASDSLGLGDLLDPPEVDQTRRRVRRLLRDRMFPLPGEGWPSLPWPAF